MTEGLTSEERAFAVEYLKETRERLLDEISGLSEAQMNYRATPQRWSIAEIMEHIINAEAAVFMVVTQQIMRQPALPELSNSVIGRVMKSPVLEMKERRSLIKDQVIILTATNRVTKRFQAPEVVRPRARLTAKADLINAFEKARARTISYIETTTDDMRSHFADHWVFGVIDAYQWILFLTAHSERHLEQIREVKRGATFPKN